MGRTHMKDSTFARVGDHLGFVAKDDVMELCKSTLATQRDHGNRDVRANSRMKYLVHQKGIDEFRKIVEVCVLFIPTTAQLRTVIMFVTHWQC